MFIINYGHMEKKLMNKICVYAICKNEIKFLNRWLSSVSEADYIVVLDTGSTDGTYEKLQSDHRVKKVKQKIYDKFRFDVARNDAMKLAPKDANILVSIDIDEVFEPGWADLVRNSWIEGVHTRVRYKYAWSHLADGTPSDVFINDKMHTRDYYWKYPVHEILWRDEPEAPGSSLNIDQILIQHYPDPEKSQSRYYELMELRVQENPTDYYSRYLFARECGLAGDYNRALNEFTFTLTLPDIKEKAYLCYIGSLILRADLLFVLGRIEDAIIAYSSILLEDKTYREPYLRLAEICYSNGMYNAAIGYVQDCLKISEQHFNWVEQAPAWSFRPWDLLGLAYAGLEDWGNAVQYSEMALRYAPNDVRLQNNYKLFTESYQKYITN